MKAFIIAYFLLLIGQLTFAQNNEVWTSFWNEETDLMGFKNSEGKTMIEPRFMGFTIARSFDNIIAVMEEINGKYEFYYLTKLGKKVGIDSLHIFDNGADCESEGYIRFKDKKTDKVGLFDKDGNVAIPAVYDALSRTHNGLIWALKGAEKKYWDKHKESGCNHYSWKGGQEFLLNTDNEVLIEDFKYEGRLDFFSMVVQDKPASDTTKESLKGVNGKYYVFTDIEKEFNQWIKLELIPNLSISNLEASTMDSLTYWKKNVGWTSEPKHEFLTRNFELIKERLQSTQMTNSDYFVSVNGLNPFMYVGDNYDKYFNTCGEAKLEKYPVLDLIINNKNDSDFTQDHFDFLKTDEGYRLINLTIRNGEIK